MPDSYFDPPRTKDSTMAPMPPPRRHVHLKVGSVKHRWGEYAAAPCDEPRLVACHDCDVLVNLPVLADKAQGRCPQCNALLGRGAHATVERTVALTLAAGLLFLAANVFPLLTMEAGGNTTQATILSGARSLWQQGSPWLAGLVLFTTFLAPLAQIVLMLYILIPLGLGLRAPFARPLFRFIGFLRVWSMAEVFVLGVLVSLVKLADMAEIVPGVALWALGLLIMTLTASLATLEPDEVWDRLQRAHDAGKPAE